jgi:hypothetical protein
MMRMQRRATEQSAAVLLPLPLRYPVLTLIVVAVKAGIEKQHHG